MKQRVILSKNMATELAVAISECEHEQLFVLTDDTTRQHCWPLISRFLCLRGARLPMSGASWRQEGVRAIRY